MIFPNLASLQSWRDQTPIDGVVAINGCFDILHPGHARLIEWAFFSCFAGPIIVGVNSDRSVARLKGAGRPVNGCLQRMQTLLGMKYVTHCVEFDELTPIEFLRACRPAVWAVGGEYTFTADPACRALIYGAGGSVRFGPTVPGYSSTRVIGKAREES